MTDLQKENDALRAQLEQYGGRPVAEIEAAAVERFGRTMPAGINIAAHEWAANRRKEASK